MAEPKKLIRIDLAETEIPQPCEKHAKQGIQLDCEDCEATEPVAGEYPELKGQWVEIRNPNTLPYGKQKELFAPKNDDERIGQFKERLATELITAWHVKDADTGELIAELPSQDPSVLDRAFDVVNPVYDAVVVARRERAVPKARSTRS